MNAIRTPRRLPGIAWRLMALATLVLFAHAVALHVLHRHTPAQTGSSTSAAAAFTTQHDAPSKQPHAPDNCPACQLQQGFVFLKATPALIGVVVAPPSAPEPATLAAAQRIAEGPFASRAPPVL